MRSPTTAVRTSRLAVLVRNIWLRRFAAAAVFVFAVVAVWWAMHLPAAAPVENAKSWTLDAGDEVTLIGPAPGRVLTLTGPTGKGIDVRFAKGALAPNALAGLQALGIAVNGQPSTVQWITSDGGVSHASVAVDLRATGPRPALVIQLTSNNGKAELGFRGQDATLRVSLSGALVPGPKTPPAVVTVGAQLFQIDSAGALPIEVDAPAGALFVVRFDQRAVADARLDWGQLLNTVESLSVLSLSGVRVHRENEVDRVYACGSNPHNVAWRTTDIERLACERTLHLNRLDLLANGGTLDVVGSGFVIENGQSQVLSWSKAAENPVLSAAGGLAFSGLVGWVIKMLLTSPPAVAAPAAPRTRSRRKPRP